VAGSAPDIIDHVRVYAVQRTTEDIFTRLPDNSQNCGRNQQADRRIGNRIPEPHTKSAKQNSQAGPTVNASMIPIGNQRGAADLIADLSITPAKSSTRP
jgi:hypothetical protein